MDRMRYKFSIVDVLVGAAVLMILAALFVPRFVSPAQRGKTVTPARQTTTLQPGR